MSEKVYIPNKKNENEQLRILVIRIQNLLGQNGLFFRLVAPSPDADHPLYQLLTEEQYALVKQMLWDEYQHHLEVIDSLRATAFILQKRIDTSITINNP